MQGIPNLPQPHFTFFTQGTALEDKDFKRFKYLSSPIVREARERSRFVRKQDSARRKRLKAQSFRRNISFKMDPLTRALLDEAQALRHEAMEESTRYSFSKTDDKSVVGSIIVARIGQRLIFTADQKKRLQDPQTRRFVNRYTFPGGHREFDKDETPVDAGHREFREECFGENPELSLRDFRVELKRIGAIRLIRAAGSNETAYYAVFFASLPSEVEPFLKPGEEQVSAEEGGILLADDTVIELLAMKDDCRITPNHLNVLELFRQWEKTKVRA